MSRIEQITAEYYEKLDKPEESTADMFQIITSQCEFDCETGAARQMSAGRRFTLSSVRQSRR